MPLNLSITPNASVPFKVHYQDDDLLVVEKPPRIPSQPGKGHESDTLLNGLFALHGPLLQNLGRGRDFGLLHRLDMPTSGLLLVGLRPRAYDGLRAQFEKRTIRKFYWAVAARAPTRPSGVIRRPILEETGEKKTAKISSAGKPAVTAYRVIQTSATTNAAIVECRPVTGRLHQVRIHLESVGCPLFGDDVYGPPAMKRSAPRLALHAHRLIFTHPTSGDTIDAQSPWPRDLKPLLKRLGLQPPSVQSGHELPGDGVGDQES